VENFRFSEEAVDEVEDGPLVPLQEEGKALPPSFEDLLYNLRVFQLFLFSHEFAGRRRPLQYLVDS
jgi:hypothetical protein